MFIRWHNGVNATNNGQFFLSREIIRQYISITTASVSVYSETHGINSLIYSTTGKNSLIYESFGKNSEIIESSGLTSTITDSIGLNST